MAENLERELEQIMDIDTDILQFDSLSHLDAQDLTGVVMTYLANKDVRTIPMAGEVAIDGVTSRLHFWLDCEDGRRIDMRLRSSFSLIEQLGLEHLMPHGIFRPADFPAVKYDGFRIRFAPLTELVYDRKVNPNSVSSA